MGEKNISMIIGLHQRVARWSTTKHTAVCKLCGSNITDGDKAASNLVENLNLWQEQKVGRYVNSLLANSQLDISLAAR